MEWDGAVPEVGIPIPEMYYNPRPHPDPWRGIFYTPILVPNGDRGYQP